MALNEGEVLRDSLLRILDAQKVTPEELVEFARTGRVGGVTGPEFLAEAVRQGGRAVLTWSPYWVYLIDGSAETVCICDCDGCRLTRRSSHRGRHCARACAERWDGFGDTPLRRWTAAEVEHAARVRAAMAESAATAKADREQRRWVAESERRLDKGLDPLPPLAPPRNIAGAGCYGHVVSAAQALHRRARKAGHDVGVALAELSAPAPPKTPSRQATLEQMKELWTTVPLISDDPELDVLLVWAELELAPRRGGLLGLRYDGLLETDCAVRLREKGDKERIQPVSRALLDALRRHAVSRGGPELGPESPVFYHRPGRWRRGHDHFRGGEWTTDPHPIGKSRFETLFRNLRKALPWAAAMRLRPHDLRHVVAGTVERNFSYAVAAAYVGHQTPTVTGTYTRATEAEVRHAHTALWGHL